MKEEYSNQNTFLSMIDMDLIRQGLLHAIQDLVFILKVIDNETFQYMYVNKIGMDYARLSEECYGKTFAEVLPKDIAGILQRQYAKVVREAKAHTFCDVVNLPKVRYIMNLHLILSATKKEYVNLLFALQEILQLKLRRRQR